MHVELLANKTLHVRITHITCTCNGYLIMCTCTCTCNGYLIMCTCTCNGYLIMCTCTCNIAILILRIKLWLL